MWISCIFRSSHQPRKCREVSSGPLSQRIDSGRPRCLLQAAGHTRTRQARVHFQRQALACACIQDGQDADPAARHQGIAGKVQRPLLVRAQQKPTFVRRTHQPLPPQPSHHPSLLPVQPVNSLGTRPMSALAQQHLQTPVSVARLRARQLHQLFSQFGVRVRSRLIAITAAVELHELTGSACTQIELLHGKPRIRSQAGKLHPFFRTIAFSASWSRLRSPTSCFKRRFSSSRLLSRCASPTSIPPYLLFQPYSVASLTPVSPARSATFRPASWPFRIPPICSSLHSPPV